MYELTNAELNELLWDAGAFGGVIGLLIGILIFVIFMWLLQRAYERNFKMWLLQLDEKERKEVYENLKNAYHVLNVLSKSNTRLFKTMHNDLMRLRSYLAQKWMQN